MKKSIVLLLLLVLSSTWKLPAQSINKLKFGALGGYAFYNQDDLKLLNQNLSGTLPFEVSIIDDFKPSFFWGGYAEYGLSNHFYLGPAYEYHYTGSRVGARDYSGTFSFDQFVHVHQFGIKSDYLFLKVGKLSFDAELNGGVSLTDWKMDYNLKIGETEDYSEHQNDHLKGFGWYLTPAHKSGYQLTSRVSLTGTAAYSFDIKENYRYELGLNPTL
jgi:hypothetical protein